MEASLANFLRQHKSHDAWWCFIKKKRNATPKDTIKPTKDKVDPSFFKDGVGSSTIGDLLQQTAAEIEKKKADDKKIEEAVSAALRVETFSLSPYFCLASILSDTLGLEANSLLGTIPTEFGNMQSMRASFL
jgi:hypothetical protein